jgi:hypothetical protein
MVQALTSVYEKSGRRCFGHSSEVTAADASDMIEAPIAKFAK